MIRNVVSAGPKFVDSMGEVLITAVSSKSMDVGSGSGAMGLDVGPVELLFVIATIKPPNDFALADGLT